jgi:hypothetical protein
MSDENHKKENDSLRKALIESLEKIKYLEKINSQEKEGISYFNARLKKE